MDEAKPSKKGNNKLEKMATVALIAIFLIALTYLVFSFIQSPQLKQVKAGTYYTNVSTTVAYDLINNTNNLTIIDCRGLEGCGTCSFKNDGHIKGAVLNSNSLTLYNTTDDILVYSKDGTVGANFCHELVNNVHGEIYNLEGGINAWKELKYPLVYGNE